MGRPKEVSALAVYLTGEEPRCSTGVKLLADDGITAGQHFSWPAQPACHHHRTTHPARPWTVRLSDVRRDGSRSARKA